MVRVCVLRGLGINADEELVTAFDGEPHPHESDVQTVVNYFDMSRDCAEAERLMRE